MTQNTTFSHIPRIRFFLRLVFPAILVFLIAFLLIGWYEDVADAGKSGSHGVRNLYAEIYQAVTHLPQVCISGGAVNEFQQRQCEKFWSELVTQGAYAVAPFLPVFVFYLFMFEALKATYRRAMRKFERGAADFPATVTNPARLPNDMYAWLFCLNSVSVQLNEKQQIRVYLAPEDPIPLPGQTMAVFILGNQFGKRRFVGRAYTPHVAVVKGTK